MSSKDCLEFILNIAEPKMINWKLLLPCLHSHIISRSFPIILRLIWEWYGNGSKETGSFGLWETVDNGLIRASNNTPVLVTRYEAITETHMKEI